MHFARAGRREFVHAVAMHGPGSFAAESAQGLGVLREQRAVEDADELERRTRGIEQRA